MQEIKDFYAEWCKNTKRGGGVLVGNSIQELLQDFATKLTPPSEAEGQGVPALDDAIKYIESIVDGLLSYIPKNVFYVNGIPIHYIKPRILENWRICSNGLEAQRTALSDVDKLIQQIGGIDTSGGSRTAVLRSLLLKSHPAPPAPVDHINAIRVAILKQCSKEDMIWLRDWLNTYQLPESAPVDTDFETALEAEVQKRDFGVAFENGAKWATRYLSAIPVAPGPWHLKSHHNTEDDDTIWITNGKMSVYVDEFNFDDFPEADYWLVNFLNRYGFKLSIDDPSSLIIYHLEEQIKHLQSQQSVRWVVESSRPEHTWRGPVKTERPDGTTARKLATLTDHGWVIDDRVFNEWVTHWLDDSPAPEQVDPFIPEDAFWLIREVAIREDTQYDIKCSAEKLLSKYAQHISKK